MRIAVTAATGALGRLVVAELVDRVGADGVVPVARNAAKADAVLPQSVRARIADYDDAEALRAAFEGVDRVLLISSSEFGRRTEQHARAIDAAKDAGVSLIVYTSIQGADESVINPLVAEHRLTEQYLAQSGVPFVLLRNGYYTENYVPAVRAAIATGEIVTGAGDGLTASATRADIAEAAAVVLTEDGHAGRAYLTSGDEAWSAADLAAAVTTIADVSVKVRHVKEEDHLETLLQAGMPALWAGVSVGIDTSIAAGEMAQTGEISRLIGRPTTTLVDGLTAALES